MSLITSNVGELLLLTWAVKSTTTPENMVLKLYKNNYTPVAGSVAADFTEADFSGYSAATLSRGNWGTPTTVSGKATSVYGSAQTFTAGSSQTVYGYYVVGATSGTLIFAERFTTAKPLESSDSVVITPSLTLDSAN